MLTSFSTALSALNANETAIDVVGNNLANMNTPGFKASVVEFSDMVSQSLGSGTGETQVGFGVATPQTRRNFEQGSLQPGSGDLTAAIQGQGFFVFQGNSGETVYSRVGNFKVDLKGNLITSTGEQAVGWSAANGAVNTNGLPGTINIPAGAQLAPKATRNVSVDLNLNTLADPANAADARNTFQVPMEVVDSRGVTHALTVTFSKQTADTWDYTATMANASELAAGGSITCTGTVTFDANGNLTTPPAGTTIAIAGLASGAANMNVNWSFVNSDGSPKIKQYASDSTPSNLYQDGYEASELLGVSIGDGGAVIADYANGQQLLLAQLAVANIRNPDTLVGIGNNEYKCTSATAEPAIGTAGTGGRGKVIGGSLEGSAVDIAKEFTNLIVYQRGYQVNSRVITTADEISQEVLNLKR